MQFQYLIEKINDAPFEELPFRHVHISNFFSNEHLKEILAAAEINLPLVDADERLFEELFNKGYKVIDFPGCILDRDTYMKWHRKRGPAHAFTNTSCEGFGMTLRLMSPRSTIISELSEFMNANDLQQTLAAKFGLEWSAVRYDTGIQKYLDGYEISPHPDTRNKALTYMVNINPAANSETQNHHTHYLKFTNEFRYVQAYWDGHPREDRCWVPWSWCQTQKIQTENNSIVIFSPRNDTMHAVKASYNHWMGQRTQMYGNLWYREKQTADGPQWEDFVVRMSVPKSTLMDKVGAIIPSPIKDMVKPRKQADAHVISDHLK